MHQNALGDLTVASVFGGTLRRGDNYFALLEVGYVLCKASQKFTFFVCLETLVVLRCCRLWWLWRCCICRLRFQFPPHVTLFIFCNRASPTYAPAIPRAHFSKQYVFRMPVLAQKFITYSAQCSVRVPQKPFAVHAALTRPAKYSLWHPQITSRSNFQFLWLRSSLSAWTVDVLGFKIDRPATLYPCGCHA